MVIIHFETILIIVFKKYTALFVDYCGVFVCTIM